MIFVEKSSICQEISISHFEAMTGALFIPALDFDHFSIIQDIAKRVKKAGPTQDMFWNGAYYKTEIQNALMPQVKISWISDAIGWGVFAAKPFKKREFIVEYSGKVRKRQKEDRKNAYCFEYLAGPLAPTPYIIDAQDQGGIARYINHGENPNLITALACLDGINHVILVANKPIAIGEQLLYDYGPDYWSKRTKPEPL